jgi:hypothetical protein
MKLCDGNYEEKLEEEYKVKNLEFFLLLLIQGLIKESEDKYLR